MFLQGVPGNFSIAEIEEEIAESTGALSVHHIFEPRRRKEYVKYPYL